MFGCLRRVGCLIVVLVLAAGLWLSRDLWYPRVFGERAADDGDSGRLPRGSR